MISEGGHSRSKCVGGTNSSSQDMWSHVHSTGSVSVMASGMGAWGGVLSGYVASHCAPEFLWHVYDFFPKRPQSRLQWQRELANWNSKVECNRVQW
ncbi:hypothetical protein AVEN_81030-1 [Araneus ventricosus]|uniref:Uncharacterized protein n=1 Tax=Araneus ventricosus TaxID=182803 RepID=A0A4Y2SE48_ARAVE|nr:hypothetical protein AVEN_148048-1 [Araneus ventricosus]GBN85535.1 hypothetical protein AVEN_81030-1 [Araneus ventricosus]